MNKFLRPLFQRKKSFRNRAANPFNVPYKERLQQEVDRVSLESTRYPSQSAAV